MLSMDCYVLNDIYLWLFEIFSITSLPFLICGVCLFLLRWSCYTREQVMLHMVLWKMFLN